jgi:hypothetical protein
MDLYTKKEWFEYINKLNDRELSKRNASGITMWAFSAFIGLIMMNIIHLIPSLVNNSDFVFSSIIVFTILINFLVTIVSLIYGYIIRFLSFSARKIEHNDNLTISIFYNLFLSIIICLGSFGNVYILLNTKVTNVKLWPFIIIVLYYLTNLSADLLPLFKNKVRSNFDKGVIKVGPKYTSNVFIIIYGLLFVINIYTMRNSSIWRLIISNIVILEFCIYLVGLLLSLLVLNSIYKSYVKGNWLEDFEKLIIANNIEAEQINEMFKKDYMNL